MNGLFVVVGDAVDVGQLDLDGSEGPALEGKTALESEVLVADFQLSMISREVSWVVACWRG